MPSAHGEEFKGATVKNCVRVEFLQPLMQQIPRRRGGFYRRRKWENISQPRQGTEEDEEEEEEDPVPRKETAARGRETLGFICGCKRE